MPKAVLVALADDVKAIIEPAVLAKGGTVERVYVPHHELQELEALKVTVVHRSQDRNRAARSIWRQDYVIDVAVQQRVANDDDTDALVLFVEQLADLISDATPSTVQATPVSVKVDPSYAPEHLDEQHVFTSVIMVTYTAGRSA